MAILRSTCLSFSMGLTVVLFSWSGGEQAYAQSLPINVSEDLARLDRAICLEQWEQAISITSELIAAANVSPTYRHDLLSFRRQLQTWRVNQTPVSTQASCDRALPLFLTLAEPEPSEPQPLDWNRALATLRNPRPIIQLDDGFEPADTIIPPELTVSSPDALADFATPIDTSNGFNVVGGNLNRRPQIYSFLARFGDRLSLETDVTRAYISGDLLLYVFDQSGRLLTQSDSPGLQVSIQDFVIPKTDVYFIAVSPQVTTPILVSQGLIVDWQTFDNTSLDYLKSVW